MSEEENIPSPVDEAPPVEPIEPAEAYSDAEAPHPDGEVDGIEESAPASAEGQPAVNLGVLEALLFSTHHPLMGSRLAELLGVSSAALVRRAVQDLNRQYTEAGRSFRIEHVAGGYQMLTLPEFGPVLQQLHQREADAKLTRAALETLAIIAYKQPILRADVEAIRGVACGETIRSLMEKHLVKIAGRAEMPGRPILYGTTRRFLTLLGLNSLKDLPQGETRPAPSGAGVSPASQKQDADEASAPPNMASAPADETSAAPDVAQPPPAVQPPDAPDQDQPPQS